MGRKIHQTAVVSPGAKIGDNVEIGPYSVIGDDVEIGDGTKLYPHVVIDGITKIGKGCFLFPGACVGLGNQDLKYKGEKTIVEIGDNTILRECVTVNSAVGKNHKTVVGSRCFVMAYSHIGHNSVIGNDVVIANSAAIAGHVTVEDFVIIGGIVAIHQFCIIGQYSIMGGCSKVVQDVLPYSLADGHPAKLYGLNLIGLKRRGFKPESILELKKAVRIIKTTIKLKKIVERINSECKPVEEVKKLLKAIEASERGFCR